MYRFSVRAVVLGVAVAVGLLLSESAAFAQCAPSNGANSARASSWVAGAQVGYNWQQGAIVYGLETDLSGTDLQSTMNGGLTSIAPCPGDAASTTAKVDWYGSLRGRVGWTADKVLFYGTAGLAYGHVNLSSNYNALLLSLSSNNSSTRAGWVVGAGIDYMLRPDLFLNLGYQYVDLGTVSLAALTSSGCCTIAQTANAHAASHVVTVGLSWRFMPGSMPWEGAYIGGHVGGAWGNSTNANYGSTAVAINCFTGITKVLMADGTFRSISEVTVGDEVLGENGEVNKVVDIENHFLGARKLYAFNDGLAFVTPDHPFMTRAGWKSIAPEATLAQTGNFSVGALKVGDEAVRLEAVAKRTKPMTVAFSELATRPSVEVRIETGFSELKLITPHDADPSTMVYNLKLDGNHTYFANNYLVHNK